MSGPQESPKSGKFHVRYNYLPHGDEEQHSSSDWQDSTKWNVCFLRGKADNRCIADVFQDQSASRNQHFLFLSWLIFSFRKLSIDFQNHLQGIFQILTGFFKSLSLRIDSRNLLDPSCPPFSFLSKRGCQFHVIIFVAFLASVQPLQASSIVQKPLDELIVYEVPTAWKAGTTTILFPSEISALYGKSIATQEQPNANFLISFVPGNYYVTLRALEKGAEDYLTIIFNRKAYIFHLVASDIPFRTLTLFNPYKNRSAQGSPVAPSQLLSILDKAKAYSLFKSQHPDALEGVLHASPNIENPYQDFTVKIKNVWRFGPQDTLVFGLELINQSKTTINYRPQDLAVKLGERIYTQSIVDASGSMPPKSTTPAFFAITGNGSGGRNHLSPDNNWSVLVIKDNKLAGGKL